MPMVYIDEFKIRCENRTKISLPDLCSPWFVVDTNEDGKIIDVESVLSTTDM